MKVVINARVLNERRGGPARYTMNIIRELVRVDHENEYVILLKSPLDLDFELPSNFKVKVFGVGSKILFDYVLVPFYSWTASGDVFLFPKNTFSPLVRGKKIPVYHDIIYYEKLGFREFNFFDHLHHSIMIRIDKYFSAADLAVSDFTASRMKELLGIREKKIAVIKEGVEDCFRPCRDDAKLKETADRFGIRRPFFFYSGSLSPRKNMLNVLKAFLLIADSVPHNIYFTGGDSWRDNDVFRFIKDNGLEERVVRLGYLSDDDLVSLYSIADCYLYPSIYEGFGLPILEAQACGTPVVCADATDLPEVAGRGALLVDPASVDAWTQALARVLDDDTLRRTLITEGHANEARFTWERTARQTLASLEAAAGGEKTCLRRPGA